MQPALTNQFRRLPTPFLFSQASLQDFVDCPRRFQLRYILRLAWPALEAEPPMENELYMQKGALFHRMVQQYLLGIPAQHLTRMIHEDELNQWWHNFLECGPELMDANKKPIVYYPEFSLSAPLGSQRLTAKYDLILPQAGSRFIIFDWKTSRKRSRAAWLKERLQTRVYPYLLACAGAGLNRNVPIRPDQIEMIYWFAAFPNNPEHIQYTPEQAALDDAYLAGLAQEIEGRTEQEFEMAGEDNDCGYCTYRSLCERGQAGPLNDSGDESDREQEPAFDFEQIAEIRF